MEMISLLLQFMLEVISFKSEPGRCANNFRALTTAPTRGGAMAEIKGTPFLKVQSILTHGGIHINNGQIAFWICIVDVLFDLLEKRRRKQKSVYCNG